METMRKPFQGIYNIIRFNRHFYFTALGVIILMFGLSYFTTLYPFSWLIWLCYAALFVIVISLIVSFYVYDLSGLYEFEFLNDIITGDKILNIHAGFDESSEILRQHFPTAKLLVMDFYDPEKHTELSIKRAREVSKPYPGTIPIQTNYIPVQNHFVDQVCVFFAAHEIRNIEERVQFFRELKRVIKPGGNLIVMEHLRDLPNFLAYNIGFFHFHSLSCWKQTFQKAGLHVEKEKHINPFVKIFILHATAS